MKKEGNKQKQFYYEPILFIQEYIYIYIYIDKGAGIATKLQAGPPSNCCLVPNKSKILYHDSWKVQYIGARRDCLCETTAC
jgi:hypothetical protein